jgi:kynureninase
MQALTDRAEALALDAQDPLAPWREQFHVPAKPDGTPCIYLCGHSLGLMPRAVRARVNEELDAWQAHGVEGHFTGARPWVNYHEQLRPGLAVLTGALPIEVVAMNSLTVNLHLLLVSFYRPTPERYKILIEQGAFPSDRYAAVAHLRWHGFDPATALIEVAPRPGETLLRDEDLLEHIDREGQAIALVLLPGTQYLTGQVLDLAPLIERAHARGAMVGLDLAHTIGNLPLQLHALNTDFAVWCSYKYLNGGPGALAGCFVHERHAQASLPRLAGWWGHDSASRFAMPNEFQSLPGAEGWQVSNPPILSSAPLLASLEVFASAGIERLRDKSVALTGFLERLLRPLEPALEIITGAAPASRGCQLSIRLHRPPAEARRVQLQLGDRGIVCDWREPDVVRIAPVPLYNSFADVWDFVATLRLLLEAPR